MVFSKEYDLELGGNEQDRNGVMLADVIDEWGNESLSVSFFLRSSE